MPDEQLPHNTKAETSVIGALLIDPDAVLIIRNVLTPGSFFHEDRRYIFEAIMELFNEQKPHTDVVLLAERLENAGRLEDIGGLAFLTQMINQTATSLHIKAHAEILAGHATLRHAIWMSGQVAKKAYAAAKTNAPVQEVVEFTLNAALDLSKARADENRQATNKDVASKTWDYLEWRSKNRDRLSGITTGIADVDEVLDGLQPDNLIILAGRAGMGKTALALHIQNAAEQAGYHPLYFSIEMSEQQMGLRMLARKGQYDLTSLRKGAIDDKQWPIIIQHLQEIGDLPGYWDYSTSAKLSSIISSYYAMKAQYGIDLLIIDHLNLVSSDKGGVRNDRVKELGYITKMLKSLARDEHMPVVALHQLNRALAQRKDKRPTLTDLRGSGEIEENADEILFIYRDEVYNPESLDMGTAEIITGKQRNGPTGTTTVKYNNFTGMFTDADRQQLVADY